jgi:mono/diheme cytochrome c family protein
MTWPRVILTAPVLPLVLWMLGAAPQAVQLPEAPPSVRESTASSALVNRSADAPTPASADGPVPEYATVVAPIVARHCTACHRAGGVAPFDLESPEALARRAATIARSVREGEMPPWFARAADTTHVFANDPSLSAADKATLLRWLESAVRPLGDLAKAPPPRGPAPEWRIGAPDLVVELPRSVEVPAAGTMPYVNLRVPSGLAADAWVRAWEVSPTARDVVHHVLVFAVPEGARGPAEEARGFFAAYVPGGGMRVYDDTRAKRLPKGSDLLFQLHYTPNGRATSDRTRLALRFADGPPQREVRTAGIFDPRLDIPPNAAAHVEGTQFTVPADLRVLSWMPHMHMRGSAFRAFRVAPDGTRIPLLDIPRYDFNWQLSYDYATPLELKRGTVIGIEGVFDNSTANPANPDASQRVRWGQQTTDEMLIGYVEYELVGAAAGAAPLRRGRRLLR